MAERPTPPASTRGGKERPIIFSGPMVRAILAGRKTMTRRLATSPLAKCQVGDVLWVRETWADVNTDSGPAFLYRADGNYRWCEQDAYPVEYERYPGCHFLQWGPDLWRGEPGYRWRSPIHMPRFACRARRIVTGVKIERLQDISEEDAIAEGISWSDDYEGFHTEECRHYHASDPTKSFASLWWSLHGEGAWEANPEVVAVSFERMP